MPIKLTQPLPKFRRAKGTTLKHQPAKKSTFKEPYLRPGEVEMSRTIYTRHPPSGVPPQFITTTTAALKQQAPPTRHHPQSLGAQLAEMEAARAAAAVAAREARVKEQAKTKVIQRQEFDKKRQELMSQPRQQQPPQQQPPVVKDEIKDEPIVAAPFPQIQPFFPCLPKVEPVDPSVVLNPAMFFKIKDEPM